MERLKEVKNVNSASAPATLNMTPKERVIFLANLIVDKILEDQLKDKKLFE